MEAYEPTGDYPRYNHIHNLAVFHMREITRSQEPVFFHWLNETEKAEAKAFDWLSIKSIPDPPYDGPPPPPTLHATGAPVSIRPSSSG